MNTQQWRHGTPSGYRNHGCRCVDCTRAAARSKREYRRRRFGPPRHRPGNLSVTQRIEQRRALGHSVERTAAALEVPAALVRAVWAAMDELAAS